MEVILSLDRETITQHLGVRLMRLILLLLLVGCGAREESTNVLSDIEGLFERDMAAAGIHLRYPSHLVWGERPGNVVGTCYVDDNLIVVEKQEDPVLLLSIVYHELIHCRLLYGHDAENGTLMSVYLSKGTYDDFRTQVMQFIDNYKKGNRAPL